jgi:hypothetical protein
MFQSQEWGERMGPPLEIDWTGRRGSQLPLVLGKEGPNPMDGNVEYIAGADRKTQPH